MRKIILIVPIITSMIIANDFKDSTPSKIIKEDVKTLKDFDTTIYNIADKKHKPLSISKIYKFISQNRAMVNDYSKLKVVLRGEVGSRTRRTLTELEEDYTLVDELSNSREYYAVGLTAIYPLYDKKTEKTIRNEKVVQENKILDKIEIYVNQKTKLYMLKEELKIVRLIQIRDKALVKTGMKYLDERIKTIERLHKIRATIEATIIKKEKYKEILKTLTTKPIELGKLL